MSRQAGTGGVAVCCLNPPQSWSLLVISSLQTCSSSTQVWGSLWEARSPLLVICSRTSFFFLEVNSPLGKLQPASLLGREPSQKMSERRNLGSCKGKWVPAHSQSPSLCVIAIPHWSHLLCASEEPHLWHINGNCPSLFIYFYLFFIFCHPHWPLRDSPSSSSPAWF